MIPPTASRSPDQRRLLKICSGLSPEQRRQLLDFAEFLLQRGVTPAAPEPLAQPLDLPAEPGESVVAATKRLTRSYFMVDTSQLLQQTSNLMSAHLLQGRPASEVIDQLESLFEQEYQKLLSAMESDR